MKGTFKKVFATVAGAAVAFSGFAASAGIANAYSATEPSTKDGKLTINNTSGHTLKAIKIASYNSDFKVKDASTQTVNQNAVEGFTLIDNPDYSTQIAAALVAAGQSTGNTDINSLYGIERDTPWGFNPTDHFTAQSDVRKFAQSLYNQLNTETGTSLQVTDPSVNTLTEGLYLVIDTSTSSTAGKDSVSVPMLVGTTYHADHIDANAKKDAISGEYLVVNSFEGSIDMKNDEIDRSKRVVDFSNDPVVMDKPSYAVGEKVNFQLKTKIPEFAGYGQNRQFKINDTLYKGLTFNGTKQTGGSTPGITSVKVGNATLTEDTDYTVSFTKALDGDTNIVIDMSLYVNKVDTSTSVAPAYGADVVVTLWATLNSNAKFANLDNGVDSSRVTDGIDSKNGNYNQLSVTYSNNPQDMSTTRTTTVATVNVYSYELKIKKGNKNGELLSGAGFLVQRTSAVSGTRQGKNLAYNEYLRNDGTHDTANNIYYTNGSTSVEGNAGLFYTDSSGFVTIRGLSEGTYLVSEKAAPNTYSTDFAKDFVFTISPAYTVKSADQDDTTWVGNGDEVLSGLEENVTVGGSAVDADNKYVAFDNAGQTSTTVKVTNYRSRSELPLTGAAGIAVFTVIGAALLSVAAYFGIRSRKNIEI